MTSVAVANDGAPDASVVFTLICLTSRTGPSSRFFATGVTSRTSTSSPFAMPGSPGG
ncbi:hypothetical protein [Prescottella equi]|uniref:hypothetical protein n=1 Tax=Rhodococcus hoagii TaxID=43767 RepID=UPI001F3D68FC|nr:hypothetical protein [Prescottella equi]